MQVQSLGYRTDLLFAKFDGVIKEHNNYWVVQTHSNPHFHWGNFVLFKQAPVQGDLKSWTRIFKSEISTPLISHMAFGWDEIDTATPSIDEFLNAGFKFDQGVVLTAQSVRPAPRSHHTVRVRPITSADDWAAAIENQIACRDVDFSEVSFREFKTNQFLRYKKMADQKLGLWFGAFLGDELVADLGIFCDQAVGRFQNVCTHPKYRRQGICSALVYQAAAHAFESMQVQTLVMVADDDGAARRVYESVGFRPTEKQYGLSWWPGSDIREPKKPINP
jgi:ribosomal protein S18 acetylase RimI-like enzyme